MIIWFHIVIGKIMMKLLLMRRKKMSICVLILLIVLMLFGTQTIYAAHDASGGGGGGSSSPSTNWWGQAHNFWNGEVSNVATNAITNMSGLVDLIKVVGNMIFVAVTVILGVKYIWGGVDSKASVKDSLITLVVAAVVFYGWNTISALFMSGNNLNFISNNATTTASTIYNTILFVCNFLAIGGIIYIGIRYMMAGAEGRSQLKAKAVPVVLGLIMVYATITFLNLIVGLI